ncbi:hypothetical protein QAD02_017173 [Eretmocerus hayati]|uniref:Uncharacterized protein n=1 Tax=Eretmocerus hayati TaxID=131215 RepID=A0ACC2PEZ8_9HYME|nr:hypothetical protein QAD02_017173 [Eretmocerus hayati]
MLVMNVDVKTNVAVDAAQGAVTINPITESNPSDFEALLNITNGERDPDYDFDPPTLPPSLPNVRIIPFVAADALVEDKEDENGVPATVTGYPTSAAAVPPPDLARADLNFHDIVTQPNLFSPPEKTEGGFVPKEPSYFEPAPLHSSNLNLEIGTGVTVASQSVPMQNPQRRNDVILNPCLYEEHEYIHGQVLPSRAACKVCLCYYGEIVCSDRKCPPMKTGCQRMKDPADECCDKIICGDSVESPTVVLDRVDGDPSLHHEPTVSHDPFRDVIKTEPAPDLPSLISDLMLPYSGDHAASSQPSHTYSDPSPNQLDPAIAPTYNDTPSNDVEFSASEGANPGILDMHKFADNVTFTNQPDFDPGIKNDQGSDVGSSLFSLDSVLDLFFNESPGTQATGTSPMISTSTPTTAATTSTTTSSPETISFTENDGTASEASNDIPRIFKTTTEIVTALPSSTHAKSDVVSSWTRRKGSSTSPPDLDATTVLPRNHNAFGGGLLKLAGCNIYGRMYQVGKLISELSSQCLECRCTEIGVHCKKLNC